MRKYLYLIKKKKIKSWLKFWLLTNNKFNSILSNIIEGTSFNLQNTVKRYFKIFNIFGNSVQDGTPSPENPVTIESVADDGILTIKQRGKNLIDNNNLQYDFSNVPNTYNQLETIETGIRYSTTYSSGTPMIIFNTGIDLTSHIGKTIKMKSTISSNAGSIRVGIANADTSLRQYKANTNISNEEISFLVTDDLGEKKYLIYYLAIDVVIGNTVDFKNLTLTIDEEPIYEPYQANDFTFQTEPLRSLPNGVRDSLEDDGIHRRVGRVVFDGSSEEDWHTSSTNTSGYSRFYCSDIANLVKKPTTSSVLTNALSSMFVLETADQTYYKNNGFGIHSNGNIYIYYDNIKEYSVQQFRNWLSTNNLEIIYELATEVIEPYTEEQQEQYNKIKELYTFNGTTNIYSTDVVPPYLQIQYYMKGE